MNKTVITVAIGAILCANAAALSPATPAVRQTNQAPAAVESPTAPAADIPACQVSKYAEDYQKITSNGGWCWFSDPRAIYIGSQVYGGYMDDEGSIWSFRYDPSTQDVQNVKIYDKLEYDDHANPSILELPDHRLMIFFSAHGPSPIYYRTSLRPYDISEWGELHQLTPTTEGNRGFCYTNPFILSEENNRAYLFFRGNDFKPNFICSDDLARGGSDLENWGGRTTLVVNNPGLHQNGRPYAKYASNGRDRIYIAFNDGHPRNEPTNSVYCAMIKGCKVCRVDGTPIAELGESIYPAIADQVYDARVTHDKAWIWDVAIDSEDRPVLVYARFADSNNAHSYWYARWNGSKWENYKICDAGTFFMRSETSDKAFLEKENNYSGGVYLDHNDPSVVYTSRPVEKVFEIEKWTFTGKGKSPWTSESVTENSVYDNIRPFVIRNYPAGAPSLLWEHTWDFKYFKTFHADIRINQQAKAFSDSWTRADVRKVSDAVFGWQAAEMQKTPLTSATVRGWKAGVMFTGMVDWARTSDNSKYFKSLTKWFSAEGWQPGRRLYHADDICVCQAYLDMYEQFGDEKMLVPTKLRADWVMANPAGENIDNTAGPSDRWWWCDALYMAPGVYSRLYRITGNKKYLKFMHQEFLATYNQLYDREEHLFFRDSKYFPRREANGQKVFWSRGNGWVLGGLMQVLRTLPANDRKYRPFYEQLFREMCARVIELQQEDGSWHSSLLDPETYDQVETSGTGLMTAALAYGINAGLLSREEYLPHVQKAWAVLVSSVNQDGRLGWVQPVGASPGKGLSRRSTELYGVGGFLLTASQIYRLCPEN